MENKFVEIETGTLYINFFRKLIDLFMIIYGASALG